ncbi:hypothetical protein [Amaricoccus solimangrovi]|uniref:Uncharacterized protein n=1 Tax=Amaricoccus solimangrovi TaxID=2589815 RepID=A0A501WBB5_9RHOB|nr:hypothetical protein [Amaricoccus solimangrovi]TPE47223.1 hypothetical protein FJM51_20425 [Amaricoccus solimangrovi]
MRAVNARAQGQRERRGALVEAQMIWIEARDRESGDIHGLGIWQGETTEQIRVTDMFSGATETRTFFNLGLISISSIRYETGLDIRPVSVTLSALSEPVQAAFRLYDARGARAQIWRRSYDPDSRLPIGDPEPRFKGFVNTAPIERPAAGGEATIEVQLVSTARMLTFTSERKKSDEAQRRREDDRFRRYKGTARAWDVPWGTKDVRS